MKITIEDNVLGRVEKPSRYTGNELNMVYKDLSNVSVRFAFCFPDVYEVGMSHLGQKILYYVLNERNDTYCERVFAPWIDMENEMRKVGIPLFSLETHESIDSFDFVGFTLQYEMSYTNVLNMLELADVPLLSCERTENHPFVCAGGPCAVNPEPLAEFIDFFVIGEAEEVIHEIIDCYKEWKDSDGSRHEFLQKISGLEGVYVPCFYEIEYFESGAIKKIKNKISSYKSKASIKKRIIKDLNKAPFPEKILVPYTQIVHDRVMLELFRGCSRGCRFCQAGFIYRPVRERSYEKLVEQASKLIDSTGYEEISLTSLSTSDYSHLADLVKNLCLETEDKKVNLSLPSLRIDSFSMGLLKMVSKVRKTGLTFAPEAGTQRLRDIINKGVTEENLMNSVKLAFEEGYTGVKLYFMLGLPEETYEDIEGIADLAKKVVDIYKNIPGTKLGRLKLTVSTSCFVPKPFTPFQWERQDTIEELTKKQRFLKEKLKSKYIQYDWHDPKLSFIEAVFARGDRRLAKVLLKARQKGLKFDSWDEYFNFDAWMEIFNDCKIDPYFYTDKIKDYEAVLPWDHIDVGINKNYLISENKKSKMGITTPDCRKKCTGCGIISFTGEGIC